uniref:Uncharacterized protein n=1 Tax=Anopheles darlingi TaxID=43151 RepID=A0A2M4DQS4_ANODA
MLVVVLVGLSVGLFFVVPLRRFGAPVFRSSRLVWFLGGGWVEFSSVALWSVAVGPCAVAAGGVLVGRLR